MQNYNNYGMRNFRNNGIRNNGVYGSNTFGNNIGWNSNGYTDMGFQANGYDQHQQADDRVFVAGRIGADAYQLPPGVNMQILWDDDSDRFYLKGYDDRGRPRVLGDFDFFPHEEQESIQQNIDMSVYATKDDIKSMVSEAIKKIKMPSMSGYVTTDEFDKALSGLTVGSGGKVVRSNE